MGLADTLLPIHLACAMLAALQTVHVQQVLGAPARLYSTNSPPAAPGRPCRRVAAWCRVTA